LAPLFVIERKDRGSLLHWNSGQSHFLFLRGAILLSANGLIYGGALIFGRTLNLSADEQWKLEVTMGIGARQRTAKLKTVPAGYEVLSVERLAFQSPPLHQGVDGALIPLAFRLRYVID
jgi:hypothetical protein